MRWNGQPDQWRIEDLIDTSRTGSISFPRKLRDQSSAARDGHLPQHLERHAAALGRKLCLQVTPLLKIEAMLGIRHALR